MRDPELEQTLRCVVGVLEQLDIPYHVKGGLASSFYGEPRLTQDIDLVVRLDPPAVAQLVSQLRVEFLVEVPVVMEAVQQGRMFQALHRGTLIRVDFHVGERIEGELSRSVAQPLVGDHPVLLLSKEDAILSKLIWVREGSEKSRRDIVGMLLDPVPINREFVWGRAKSLDCEEILADLERVARGH